MCTRVVYIISLSDANAVGAALAEAVAQSYRGVWSKPWAGPEFHAFLETGDPVGLIFDQVFQ